VEKWDIFLFKIYGSKIHKKSLSSMKYLENYSLEIKKIIDDKYRVFQLRW
jgi:hypothetical protein